VLQLANERREAFVQFPIRTATGRLIFCRCWLPFERLASDRAKFAARWASLAHAEKSAAFLLAGACASSRRAA